MGCGTSSAAVGPNKSQGKDFGLKDGESPFTLIVNEKCPMTRLDTIKQPKDVLGLRGSDYEVDIKYCYVSQRGYYPNALNKANQDSYLVMEDLLGDKGSFVFGIFDGHGDQGDYCSHFAAENFATCLAKELADNGGLPILKTPKMTAVYTQAFVKTNKLLKKSPIDDSLSGTTGVTILLNGDTLYVGNVGDSRAIIASEGPNEKLVYSPLSSDQTPFRKDERERLKKRGAVIMTIEQIEGNEEVHENWGSGENVDESGDPPRVWDSTLEKPGCAFTRSIGDSVAEKIGVYAEPEVLTWKLQPNDRFAIVASDGVFEFLSSQAVVDMISKFGDILEGCKHVVAEAYRLWLQFDERTDDITIILISFEDIRQRTDVAAVKIEERVLIKDSETARPVRTVMSKTKRKEISENFATDEAAAAGAGGVVAEFDVDAVATAKTDEELRRIGLMLKANFMFQNLDPEQREKIFKVMQLRSVSAGEQIITEGAAGEEMYIIDAGEFTVHKKDESGVEQLVFTYTNTGASFGELSLMYGKPRAASVRAKTDGRLWVIGRLAFRAVLMKKKTEGLIKLFKAVPLFKDLSLPTVQRISASAVTVTFNDGEQIVSANAADDKRPTWCLCVILSGGIKLSLREQDSTTSSGGGGDGAAAGSKSPRRQVRTEGMFFAQVEVGMTFDSAVADGRTKLSCLPTAAFTALLGDSALDEVRRMVQEKTKGKTGKRKPSMFSTPELLALPPIADPSTTLSLQDHVVALGNFATVGLYKRGNVPCSAKVICKKNACAAKVDARLLLERQILAALAGNVACVPKVASAHVDKARAWLVYEDVFQCDLQVAMANGAVPDEEKVYYAACLYSAVSALHEAGIILRFLNPGVVYITSKGIPKVRLCCLLLLIFCLGFVHHSYPPPPLPPYHPQIVDLRYAKKMDGHKVFTICGDPLYFAPEIVTQRGYDHGADLWALGLVYYELFEGHNPIGTHDSEETAIFKKLASFSVEALEFTKKSPKKVKSIVAALLEPDAERRLGYGSPDEVKGKKVFSGIDWRDVGRDRIVEFELVGRADPLEAADFANVDKPSAFDSW